MSRPAVERLESRLLLAVVSWISDTDGFWDVAANWQDDLGVNRIPDEGDDVTIARPDADVTVTVTFRTGTLSINALSSTEIVSITGGTLSIESTSQTQGLALTAGVLTGTGNLTVSGLFDWVSGTHTGAGTTTIAVGAELLMRSASKTLSQRTINNSGTMTLTGGLTTTSDDAVINNLAGGLFDFAADISFGTTTAANTTEFNNAGTLRKSIGNSTATFRMPVHNTGIVEALAGTMVLTGGGSSSSEFEMATGALLELNGTFALNAGATSSGAGILEVSGGTTTINGPVSVNNLHFSAGILTGTGTLTVTGLFDWVSGTHTGTGTTTIEAGAQLLMRSASKTLSQRTINNSGTMTLTGGTTTTSEGTVINNLADGLFDIASNTSFGTNSSADTTEFNNAGTLRKSIGELTATFGMPVNNTGVVEALAGVFVLSGTLANYDGAAFTLTGGTFRAVSSTLRLTGADIRANAASIELDGALARLERATSQNALVAIHTNAEGASLVVTNNADLATVGSFNNSGSLTVGPGSTVTVSGDLQQTSTGALLIAVGGTPASGRFGELHVTGAANVAGTFDVLLADGFGPTVGQTYEVSTFASRNGDFETVRTPLLGIDPAFAVLRSDTDVTLNALVTASDLRTFPTGILLPLEARPGDEIVVQYIVENISDRDALGDWVDSLYLSRDSVLDAGDLLLARVPYTGGLASLSSYSQMSVVTLIDGDSFDSDQLL